MNITSLFTEHQECSSVDSPTKELVSTDTVASSEPLETHWVVERREIQQTGPGIGKGNWATVSKARFRGLQVAAKHIHSQTISPQNKEVFKREMEAAVKIHHPNLAMLIGATLEGEMIILTELMPTSLKNELKEDYFTLKQTMSIGLDVARALNYLHLMRPHPLIHQNITSANVLLEPLPNHHWRAKVSDFGMVHLLKQLQIVHPGNPSYAAPEANNPTQHSPKMDIFSFGVLLLEMLTGELQVTSDQRQKLLLTIRHKQLQTLIQRCLDQNKDYRPSASDVLNELENLLNPY